MYLRHLRRVLIWTLLSAIAAAGNFKPAIAESEAPRRLLKLWIAQRDQIKTAAIDYRSFSNTYRDFSTLPPFRSDGELKPLPADEVERLFAEADLPAHPDRFAEVVAKLLEEPFRSSVRLPEMHFYQEPAKRAFRSDRTAHVFGDGLDISFDAVNRQAVVRSVWPPPFRMERLSDFRWQPNTSPGTYRFVGAADGLVHLKGTDREDFYFDETTGILSRMVVHNSEKPLSTLLLQSGRVESPDGIVFPALSVRANFGVDGRLRMIKMILIEKAQFNTPIDPQAFKIRAPAGASVIDHRLSPQRTQRLENEADSVVDILLAADRAGDAARGDASPAKDQESGQDKSQNANPNDFDTLGRFEQLWIAQQEDIKTAAIDFRAFYTINSGVPIRPGFPSRGDLKPLSRDDVDRLFTQADLPAHPERFADLIAKLMQEPPQADAAGPVMHFYWGGGKLALQSDRRAFSIAGGLMFDFDPATQQADLYANFCAVPHYEKLPDFRWQPGTSPGTYHFVDKAGGLVRLTGPDHDDLLVDEATGLMLREVDPDRNLNRLMLQSGLVEYPGGVVFPSLSVRATFAEGQLVMIMLSLIEKAKFNAAIDPRAFDVRVPAGTLFRDHRARSMVRNEQTGENEPRSQRLENEAASLAEILSAADDRAPAK